MLHDNEDGTFSERGKYAPSQRQGGNKGSVPKPAIVVSRGPADASSTPALPPSLPRIKIGISIGEAETDKIASVPATPSGLEPADNSEESENSDFEPNDDEIKLWNYIQPHLVKHRGPRIPTQGWVRRLITLPKVRDLDWNAAWLEAYPFTDPHPRDVSALIIQATGDVAPDPCSRCRDGKGPFLSCVIISADAGRGPLESITSCANCFYHGGQIRCSNKQTGAMRAARLLKLSDDGEAADVEMEGDEVEEVGGNTIAIEDDEVEDVVDSSIAELPPQPDGDPVSIVEAEPGRPYTMWPGKRLPP